MSDDYRITGIKRAEKVYVDEDLSMGTLARRWGVSAGTVGKWVAAAGIPARTRRQAGARRLLSPPPVEELRRLHEDEGLSPGALAAALGVHRNTVGRWLADAGVARRPSSRKGRMRGQRLPAARPDAALLRELYEERRLSLSQVAETLGVSVHLVRTWLEEEQIPRRRGTYSTRRPPPRRRWQPPPAEELRRLRVEEHWTMRELAAHYGVHQGTVARWLADYEIPAVRASGALAGITVAEVVRRYTEGDVTAAELARQTGLRQETVAAELKRAGVAIDRSRPRPRRELSEDEVAWAEERYVSERWSLRRIAGHLSCPDAAVRCSLEERGVEIRRRASPGRQDRREAPLEAVERLYVRERQTSEQVGERLEVRPGIVLRTGHAHGLPIRPPGPNPLVPAEVQLIEALYADDEVREVLDRHAVPVRPPVGGIAVRFPEPVALTPELLCDLYVGAGCSSLHVELLTGQSEAVIRHRMKDWGVPVRRRPRSSPVLLRIRAALRQSWLDGVARRYEQCRSTAQIAAEYGCSQETARRWLIEAGSTLPPRGRWDRRARLTTAT
ncbi:MAG: hypothetical protein M3P85_04640 [Actinomycetota bacterium]|nr:hypothetical protein [Actinomycetota bacterium]